MPGMINRMALFALLTATFLQALDLTIATIALPAIEQNFGLDVETGGWILTRYIVAAALMTPVGGGLTVASLACGVAGNFASLIVARLAQGASAGIILPLVQATLFDMMPKADH